jgi:hypothetical protein
MTRLLLAALALAALPAGSRAGEAAVRLTVHPMPAPRPALKYQLLPEVRELNPGNPAQWYVRCFQEQRYFFFGKEANAERARYLSIPLADVPWKKLPKYGGSALTQADWGARLDALDWEALQHVQNNGLDLMLPELGPLRVLAVALRVRLRIEVAGRNYDNAVRSTKTMFALARHLGEYPTEAANRIGLSVADLALDGIEEMVQQPNCPNLYWALTDLPCPPVDLHKGFQGYRCLVAKELRPLRDDTPMTAAEVEELVSRLSGAMGFGREQAGETPRNLRAALNARAEDPERVRAARGHLIEAHYLKDLLAKLPPLQVILLDEKREYEARRDDALKLLALAPWQTDALAARAEAGHGGDALLADLVPDVVKARRAQARLEQRVALLRHVEALRLHAAAHGGRLPATLDEVAVPLPADPFTGKPFRYTADGAAAHLRSGEDHGASTVHYELVIQKGSYLPRW